MSRLRSHTRSFQRELHSLQNVISDAADTTTLLPASAAIIADQLDALTVSFAALDACITELGATAAAEDTTAMTAILEEKTAAFDVIHSDAKRLIFKSSTTIHAATPQIATGTPSTRHSDSIQRLPAFDTTQPRQWFRQCALILEADYNFPAVLSKIPTSAMALLNDAELTRARLSLQDFQKVLLPKLESSPAISLQQLIQPHSIGEHSPTSFLRLLQDLALKANQPTDSALVKQQFISTMPTAIRPTLAAQSSSVPLEEVAALADSIISLLPASEPMAAVTTRGRNASPHKSYRRHSSSRSPNRARQLCWYHERFGKNAKRCEEPCDWKPFSPKNAMAVDEHQQ